jgi:hypothetical protein
MSEKKRRDVLFVTLDEFIGWSKVSQEGIIGNGLLLCARPHKPEQNVVVIKPLDEFMLPVLLRPLKNYPSSWRSQVKCADIGEKKAVKPKNRRSCACSASGCTSLGLGMYYLVCHWEIGTQSGL